jgi:hypothetical protein
MWVYYSCLEPGICVLLKFEKERRVTNHNHYCDFDTLASCPCFDPRVYGDKLKTVCN